MRVLMALTYYHPYTSGQTVYAVRLAQALVRRGHQVTVLTSRFRSDLPKTETLEGVNVIRAEALLRVSKGLIMPQMTWLAMNLVRSADVVNLHLPQLDAAPIALISRSLHKPVIATYHCDLELPPGLVSWAANRVSDLANHITARAASVIIQNSRDYAEHSPFLRRYISKVRSIEPPVDLPPASEADCAAFVLKYGISSNQPLIGMAARLAAEKGVHILAQAMPLVLESYPQARVLIAGPNQNLRGEEAYAEMVLPLTRELGKHWNFLGVLSPLELAAFFRLCDLTVLPSLNRTESFGLVQVESMANGTPVIASDLPGVRVPVQMTGMGRTIPLGDAHALAKSIIEVLDHPQLYRRSAKKLVNSCKPDRVAAEYEKLFEDLRTE